MVTFSLEMFLGKPKWLVALRGCLAPFVLRGKASKHPICSFRVKPKIFMKWTKRHPHIRSKPHDSFPMTSHCPRRHPMAFGVQAPRNFESVYYNLQFWLFFRHFWNSPGLVIFSLETFLGVLTWLVTLSGCLAPFMLPRKAFEHPICLFLVKLKNVSKWT